MEEQGDTADNDGGETCCDRATEQQGRRHENEQEPTQAAKTAGASDNPRRRLVRPGALPSSGSAEEPAPSPSPHRQHPATPTMMISGDGVLLPPRTPAQLASLLKLLGLSSAPDLVRPGGLYNLSYNSFRRLVQCQTLYYGRPVTVRTTARQYPDNNNNNNNNNGTENRTGTSALRVLAASCCDPHCPFRLETVQEFVDVVAIPLLHLPQSAPLEFQRVVTSHQHHCTVRDHTERPLVLDNDDDQGAAAAVTSTLLQLDRLVHVADDVPAAMGLPLLELARLLHEAYGLDYACSPVRLDELGRAWNHAQQQQQLQQQHQLPQQPQTTQQLCQVPPMNAITAAPAPALASADTAVARGVRTTPPTPLELLEDRDLDQVRYEAATSLQLPPKSSGGRLGATTAKRKRESLSSSPPSPSPEPTSRDCDDNNETRVTPPKRRKIRRTLAEKLVMEAAAFTSVTGRRPRSVEAKVPVPAPPAPASPSRKVFGGGLKTTIRPGPRPWKPRTVRPNKSNSPIPTAAAPKRRGRQPKERPQKPAPTWENEEEDHDDETTADPATVVAAPKRRGRKPMMRRPETSPTLASHGYKSTAAPELVMALKCRGRKPQVRLAPALPTEPISSSAEHSTQDQLPTPSSVLTTNVETLEVPRRRGRHPRVRPDLSTEVQLTVQGDSPEPGEELPRRRGRWPKKSSAVASAPPAQSSVQEEPSKSANDLTSGAAALEAPKRRGRRPRSEPDVTLIEPPVQDESPMASSDVFSLPALPTRRGRSPKSTGVAPPSAPHAPDCLVEPSLGQVQARRAAPKRRGRAPKTVLGAPAENSSSVQDELLVANEELMPNTAMAGSAASTRPGRPRNTGDRSKSDPPPFDLSKQEHQMQDEVTTDLIDLPATKTSTQDTEKQRHGKLVGARGVSSPSRLSLMNPAAVQTLARTTTTEPRFDRARTTASKPMDSLATATLPAAHSKSSSADGQLEGNCQRLGVSPPQSLRHPPALFVGQPESHLAEPAAGPLEAPQNDRQVRSPQSVSETFQSLTTETSDSPLKTLGHDLDGQEWCDDPPLNLKLPEQTRHGPVASMYSGLASSAAATALFSKMRLTYHGAVFEAVRVPDAVPKDPDGSWFDTVHEYGPWLETGQGTNESRALRFSSYPFLFRPSVQGLANEYQNLVLQDVCLPTRMNLDSADSLRKSVDAKLFSLKSHEDKNECAVEEVNQEHKVYKRSLAAHRRGEEQELLAKLNDDGDAAAHRSRQMWNAAHRFIHRTAMKNHEATAAALAELALAPVLFESEGPVHVTDCHEMDCATCRGSERPSTAVGETADALKRTPMPRYRTVEIMPYSVGGNPLVDGHRYRAKMSILKLNELQNSITFVEDFARLGSRSKCLQTHHS